MANLHTRLNKLEESKPTRALGDMSDAEIERFLRRQLGLPPDTPLTDDMLEEVVRNGAAR